MDSNRMHTFLDIQRERDQNRTNPLGLASWFQLTAPIIGSPSPAPSSSSAYVPHHTVNPPHSHRRRHSTTPLSRSQARNPLAAQLHQFFLNLDPPRSVASVNSSPPSLLANALSVHAPDLVISSIGAPHPSAQDDAAVQQIALVDACFASGVPRLLLVPLVPLRAASESGYEDADAGGADGRVWDGVTAGKAQARVLRHLCSVAMGGGGDKGEQEQGDGASRTLEWVGVACGTILDAALVNGQFGVDMKWASAEVIGDGTREFDASSSTWVCRALAAVVEHWDRIPRNQLLHVAGCVTTPNDVLRCLEAVTEQSHLASFVAVEDAVHEARKRIERGFVDKGAELLERCNLLALGAD